MSRFRPAASSLAAKVSQEEELGVKEVCEEDERCARADFRVRTSGGARDALYDTYTIRYISERLRNASRTGSLQISPDNRRG